MSELAEVRHLRLFAKDEALGIARDSFAQACRYHPETPLRVATNHIALSQLAAWLDKAEAL